MTTRPPTKPMSASEVLARAFHDTYERLAPQFGYETREDTREFDPKSKNGRLMIAVCGEIQARNPVSTHHVHRRGESLPCYCPGKNDHPIGAETQQPAPDVAGGVGATYSTSQEDDGVILRNGVRMTADEIVAGLRQSPGRVEVGEETTWKVARALWASRKNNEVGLGQDPERRWQKVKGMYYIDAQHAIAALAAAIKKGEG